MSAALACPPARAARSTVVVRPAPRREPPFDDEVDAPVCGRYDQRLPFAVAPTQLAWQPRPYQRKGVPDPSAWGRRLVVGMIETAAGRRPLHQLSPLLSPSVSKGLVADFERAAASGTPHWLHRASMRTVRACEPVEGVAELSATVDTGPRVRAIAIRLETHHGRWRCTRLQLG